MAIRFLGSDLSENRKNSCPPPIFAYIRAGVNTVRGLLLAGAFVFTFALGGCEQVTDRSSGGNNNIGDNNQVVPPAFVAVTNITLKENSRVKGTTIDLNALAVVHPENATVKGPISWWVIDAGTTGVELEAVANGTVTPTTAGMFTLSATIANAITEGTDAYSKWEGLAITVTDAFVAVTDITGIAATGKTGVPIDLSGAVVAPANATHSAIVWTASGAGLSGTVSGTSVTPSATGTLTLTATIANGTAEGTNYTKNFTVDVSAGTGINLSGVTLNSVDQTGGVNNPFAATDKVTLTFSQDVAGLEAEHIIFAADGATVAKGTLVSKGSGVYELPVDALLSNGGPNKSETFAVTVSDGDNSLSASVTLYAWIAVDTKETLAKIGVGEDAENYPLSGWYKQTANITILNTWTPIGSSSTQFTGVYDGGDKVIFPQNISVQVNFSIFGYTSGAKLKNIHIGGGTITSTLPSGSIASTAVSTKITDCSNAATLTVTTNNMAGGICAIINNGTVIDHCWNTGKITGGNNVGGIHANATGTVSEVKNCYNSGDITGNNSSGNSTVGGISSGTGTAKVTACYNTGTVTANGSSTSYAGGIAGASSTFEIIACSNRGAVTSSQILTATTHRVLLGGIIGRVGANTLKVTASYNTGTISWTGSDDNSNGGITSTGGVIGFINVDAANLATACYWTADSSPTHGIGYIATSATSGSNAGTTKFSDSAWPAEGTDTAWGMGQKDGSDSGHYWASLGSYNGNYPRLWFEK
jgi:hypothetical protein